MSVSCVTIFLSSILFHSVLFNIMEENIDFILFSVKSGMAHSVKCEGVRKEMQSVTAAALQCWIRRQREV